MTKAKNPDRQRNSLAGDSSPRYLETTANDPIKIRIRIGIIEQTRVLMLTDAPTSYDGFGTFTVVEYPGPIEGITKKDSRLVAVLEEHTNWQRARYQSGLHAACTDLAELGIEAREVETILWNNLLRFAKVEAALKESVEALKESRRRIEASDEFETYDLSHQIDRAQNVLNNA